MKVIGGSTFVRFGTSKKDNTPIPEDVEKKLTEIAKKFGADVEKAKKMYQGMKNLKYAKLTDEQIFKVIEHDLDPNSPKITTLAIGEEGGMMPKPPRPPKNPPVTTMALGEEGGR